MVEQLDFSAAPTLEQFMVSIYQPSHGLKQTFLGIEEFCKRSVEILFAYEHSKIYLKILFIELLGIDIHYTII